MPASPLQHPAGSADAASTDAGLGEPDRALLLGAAQTALLFDDMISTAGSICGAAEIVKRHGAREIYIAATHGVLCGSAHERLSNAPIREVVITNTIPLAQSNLLPNVKVLSVAPLIAEAIKRIHLHQSVSNLFPG